MLAFLFFLTFWHETPAMATDDDIDKLVVAIGSQLEPRSCVEIDFTETTIWWRLKICKVPVRVSLGSQAMWVYHYEEEVELL